MYDILTIFFLFFVSYKRRKFLKYAKKIIENKCTTRTLLLLFSCSLLGL